MADTLSKPLAQVTRGNSEEKFPSEITYRHSARVFGLDFLRAAAILSVFIAHSIGVLMPHLPWWFVFCGHGGFYGVELFFVLSGFLIGTILIRSGTDLCQPDRIATFYIRRWFRTLPLFWLFLCINVAIEYALRSHYVNSAEIWSHGFFLRNLTTLRMTFFPESWSLAIEEWFYLLFPAALWLALRFDRRFDRAFLTVAIAFFLFSTIGRMVTSPHAYATWTEWQRKVAILRFDSLMIGVFGAWIATRYPSVWRRHTKLLALAGAILLIAMYAWLWKFVDHQVQWSADAYFARTFRFTLVSLGFALLLPAASDWSLKRENIFSTNIRRIALWSYALYLVHLPVIALFQQYWPKQWSASALQASVTFLLQVGCAITVSALLYRFFESRCTHLRETVAPIVTDILRGKFRRVVNVIGNAK